MLAVAEFLPIAELFAEPAPIDHFDRFIFGSDSRDGADHPSAPEPFASITFAAGDWSHCQAAWAMLPAVLQEAIKNGTPAILTIEGREYRIVARLDELPGYLTHELADPMGNRYLPFEGDDPRFG